MDVGAVVVGDVGVAVKDVALVIIFVAHGYVNTFVVGRTYR